jgi:acetyltransferase (GNAT) family protein
MPCHGSITRGGSNPWTLCRVWSLSCFYVRKGYRRQGVTSALIGAALKAARRTRAPALEAYPLDADLTPSAFEHGLRLDLRPHGLPDGRSPRAASSDHASRSPGALAVTARRSSSHGANGERWRNSRDKDNSACASARSCRE